MNRILFFDFETTGLVHEDLPITAAVQPHPVQLAVIYDVDGLTKAGFNVLINPEIPIPKEASDVHGITDDMVRLHGVEELTALAVLINLITVSDLVVGHNVQFDLDVARIAARRAGVALPESDTACTMALSTPLCRIPYSSGRSWKRPRLIEAYKLLVDPDGFSHAHSAMADVRACRAVYYAVQAQREAA